MLNYRQVNSSLSNTQIPFQSELTRTLSKDINENIKRIKSDLGDSSDLIIRQEIAGNCSSRVYLVIYNNTFPWEDKRALKKAELKDSRFHDLRHSHATIFLQSNVHPKIVSERLDHSKIGITLDLYSHAIPSLQKQAVELLDDDDDKE